MSTVCSISILHSDPSPGHTERTSIAILCHDVSNNLWPSSKLAMPALPLHGSNFRKGVKFSVQTTSRGSVPCNRYMSSSEALKPILEGSKVILGLVVLVASMKLSEAQNRPERALLSVTHLAKDLQPNQLQLHFNVLFSHPASESALTHAQSSTPVPPSFAPPHGLAPQLSSSHLPVVNLR